MIKYIYTFAARRGLTMDRSEIKKEGIEGVSEFDNVDSEYRKLVNLASDKNLDFDISNSSLDHAKYLVMKLFEHTQKEFNIFIKSSNLDIFSNIVCSEKENPIEVNVLLDESTKESQAKLNKIFSKCNVSIQPIKNIDERLPYFIVGDSKRFRISPRRDGNTGTANFNKPEVGGILARAFHSNWNV